MHTKLLSHQFADIIQRATVSDLFFNHTHPTYDALFSEEAAKGGGPSHQQQRAAIRKDADDFADQFGGDPEWYAEDFLKRV